jgi:hypothetical protein
MNTTQLDLQACLNCIPKLINIGEQIQSGPVAEREAGHALARRRNG